MRSALLVCDRAALLKHLRQRFAINWHGAHVAAHWARVRNNGLGNRQTASVHLKMLVDIGVLKEVKVGREKLFIHPKFVNLLLHEKQDFTDYDARRKKSPLRDAPGVLPKKGRR